MVESDDFWVFAYGSLMWNPGFEYREALSAKLFGYHRSLCILSWTFRGQRGKPGLVLGLDYGGSCLGRAYRVAGELREPVIKYLDDREIPDHGNPEVSIEVYRRREIPVHLTSAAGPRQCVQAVCYVAERAHEQYAGELNHLAQLHHILQGEGSRGTSVDYLMNVIRYMDDLGINDGPLHRLWTEVLAYKSSHHDRSPR